MRTIWTGWALDDMRNAAEMEGRVSLTALDAPEQRLVESLPYYGAFCDYRAHVTGCDACRYDDQPDCPEGNALLGVSHVGVDEQRRTAASN
jgi:hypothetical protein